MTKQEQNMRRYLLGDMTEAEREALEQGYFHDKRLFDLMMQSESNLNDEYARGLLPPDTRELFERNYLAYPPRRDRAQFAVALAARVDDRRTVVSRMGTNGESLLSRFILSIRGPRFAWALSAAVVLLIAAVAGLLLLNRERSRQETAKTQTAPEQPGPPGQVANVQQSSEASPDERGKQAENQKAVEPPRTKTSKATALATLVLTVSGTRGLDTEPQRVLVINEGTKQVRLQLNVRESDYSVYRAVLRSVGGEEIFVWARVSPQKTRSGGSLILILDAQKFVPDGDYILTLSGVAATGEVEEMSKSLFRVRKT